MIFIMQRLFVVLMVIFLSSESSMIRGVEMDYNNRDNYSTLQKLKSYAKNLIGSMEETGQITINVDDFGANADGTDDSQAFLEAWKKACNTSQSVLLVPPNKTYLLKPPVDFVGPCQPKFTMSIQGTIEASSNLEDYKNDPSRWIRFNNVEDFTVNGGGSFNGNGKVWWDTSCKVNPQQGCHSGEAPTAVTFNGCKDLRVNDLHFMDAQQMQLMFYHCQNVDASNLMVTAPEKSPNTDGIHVALTENIIIENCIIGTGDDCISIVNASKNVEARNITCGPGHGISIGSLGKNHEYDIVSDVYVKNATLNGTLCGARIKTWQGGKGYAKNITFEDMVMTNVKNPIIITQNYCDQQEPCTEQNDAVVVENIVFNNIKGTSATEVAINFNCSKSVPCQNIKLENINLVGGEGVKDVKTFSANANITTVGDIIPPI